MTRITLDDDNRRLCIETSFANKEKCKALPGARWSPAIKQWTVPASPSAADAIAAFFPQSAAQWSADALTLLAEAETITKASLHKESHSLPSIPQTKTEPWLHQLRAFWFAHDIPATMLALDMGVGKTKIVIDLIVNMNWRRVLVLCPKSVIQVWPAEFEKHAAAPVGVLAPDDDKLSIRSRQIQPFLDLCAVRQQPAVVVLNYDAAWREVLSSILFAVQWDAVICDESHRIKAPGGKAALFCSRLGDKVPRRLCLTGTPLPHSPMDAYAQYRFLDKGIFGTSFVNFRARYAIMGGFGAKQVVGYQNEEEFHRKFYSIAYRVKSEDVQTLPEAIDVVRPVTLSKYAYSLYKALKEEFVVGIGDGSISAGNALTRLLRLQQLGSGWARLDRDVETGTEGQLMQVDSGKQEALADILEDLHESEPVVIFCRFHHDLDAVHTVGAALGRQSLELSGRRNELREWQSGAAPLLAVQTQSGGVGVNLVRARYCVFYSLGFSLGDYLQARKRTHRPGQTQTVTYLHLIAQKTVDVDVYKALAARQDVVDSILAQERV